MACADTLRETLESWLPAELLKRVAIPDSLDCNKQALIISGPAGSRKSTLVRRLPNCVKFYRDELQYAGPCDKRLRDLRGGRGDEPSDEKALARCEQLGEYIQDIAVEEAAQLGANIVIEFPYLEGHSQLEEHGYGTTRLYVIRPFEDCYESVIRRHTNEEEEAMASAASLWPSLTDYVRDHYVPVLLLAVQASTNGEPLFFVQGDPSPTLVDAGAAIDELCRAFRHLNHK